MTVGDKDCCAIRTCGHGEVWHPTCCGDRRQHRFARPLVVEGKVLLVGDRFYYDFKGDKDFPNDPKGWVRCTLSRVDGPNGLIVKPLGFERFIISREDKPERFRLSMPDAPKEAGA